MRHEIRIGVVLAVVLAVFAAVPSTAPAVEIEHYAVSVPGQQTTTGSSGWFDVTGATIDGSNFTAGDRYLLMLWGEHNNSANDRRSGMRLTHGGTQFDHSQSQEESDRTGDVHKTPYFFTTLWTAQNQDLQVQFRNNNATSGTARVEDVTLVAINAEGLIANGDLHFNENTTASGLSTTYVDKASVTFTPDNADDAWWMMGYTRADIIAVNGANYRQRLQIDNSTARSVSAIEGEDGNDYPVYGLGWVQTLDDAEHEVSVQVSENSTNQGFFAAGLFALRLNAFESFAYDTDPGNNPVMAVEDQWYEQAAIDPTVQTEGDWLIAAGTNFDDDNAACKSRIQLDGSDITDETGGWQQDPANHVPNTVADFQTDVSPGTLDIDFDTKADLAVLTSHTRDAWVVGFSMELIPEPGTVFVMMAAGLPALLKRRRNRS